MDWTFPTTFWGLYLSEPISPQRCIFCLKFQARRQGKEAAFKLEFLFKLDKDEKDRYIHAGKPQGKPERESLDSLEPGCPGSNPSPATCCHVHDPEEEPTLLCASVSLFVKRRQNRLPYGGVLRIKSVNIHQVLRAFPDMVSAGFIPMLVLVVN